MHKLDRPDRLDGPDKVNRPYKVDGPDKVDGQDKVDGPDGLLCFQCVYDTEQTQCVTVKTVITLWSSL